jgi:multicomponent Na+:H+ antiporter subunit G
VSELRVAGVLCCAVIGTVFALLAGLGVLRMPDLYSRMQASSKAATVGAIFSVAAVAIHFGTVPVIIRGLALAGFLFLTVPVAAHLIARAGFVAGAALEPGAAVDESQGHDPLDDGDGPPGP